MQMKDYRPSGRPCGGARYNEFHSDSKGENNVTQFIPLGYKWCSKRGLVKIKEEPAVKKKESKIEELTEKKEEINKDEQEIKEIKKDELSLMVEHGYSLMQTGRDKSVYNKTQSYQEIAKVIEGNFSRKTSQNNELCPLCGSKLSHQEEESYSKAA